MHQLTFFKISSAQTCTVEEDSLQDTTKTAKKVFENIGHFSEFKNYNNNTLINEKGMSMWLDHPVYK